MENTGVMNHIIILTLVLNLLAGTAVFLYSLAAWRKFRLPCLKILLAYILSFIGLNVVDFCYQYARINVFRSDPSLVTEGPVLGTFLLFLVYCAEIAITVNLCRMVECLKGRKLSKSCIWFLGLWAVFFAAGSFYGILLLFRTSRWQVFYWIHAGWMFSMILIILTVLVCALAFSRGKETDQNSLGPFAWIFLAGYGLFTIVNLDFYFFHTGFQRYYDPLVLLIINVCPFFWLRFYFERENNAVEAEANHEVRLDGFCEKYGVSKREKEIIQQVLIGKSNKEIEGILFISYNTVKNHLYNVYQKTGVNSRSELIHRVNRFGE